LTDLLNRSEPTRRDFLKTVAGSVGALAVDSKALAGETSVVGNSRRPNLVFFLGEGVRWDEFSYAGNPLIRTPNFDRLAREGVSFTNSFVTNALCTPSRASTLCGMYSHDTGVLSIGTTAIPATMPTLCEQLRDAGYDVGLFGKGHVPELEKRNWSKYLAISGSEANYYHPVLVESENGNVRSEVKLEGYFDDVVTDRAVEWMNEKRDKPFCLFLWFMAPHAPFYRARRHADLYNGVAIPKPATFDDDLKGYPGKPKAFHRGFNRMVTGVNGFDNPRSLEEMVKDHYAGTVATDDNAGKVTSALEKRGILDDTAILFTSDHGFFLGEWGLYNKMLMHEPSIRVPFVVRYPKMVRGRGVTRSEMTLNIDIAPTLLEIVGLSVPKTFQGRSLVPLMQGQSPGDWRKDWYYEYFDTSWAPRSRGVRTETHKLIEYWEEIPAAEYELYDLENDPAEVHNLYGDPKHAELERSLKQRLTELRAATGDTEHPQATVQLA
jgi:arylsulfatase A-like enzyme